MPSGHKHAIRANLSSSTSSPPSSSFPSTYCSIFVSLVSVVCKSVALLKTNNPNNNNKPAPQTTQHNTLHYRNHSSYPYHPHTAHATVAGTPSAVLADILPAAGIPVAGSLLVEDIVAVRLGNSRSERRRAGSRRLGVVVGSLAGCRRLGGRCLYCSPF